MAINSLAVFRKRLKTFHFHLLLEVQRLCFFGCHGALQISFYIFYHICLLCEIQIRTLTIFTADMRLTQLAIDNLCNRYECDTM
jgi:hypothetical protein